MKRVGVWCLNCSAFKVTRPRGLCWRCYYTPEIRGRYAPGPNPHTRKFVPLHVLEAEAAVYDMPPPPEPTAAPPGTEEKIRVMEGRVAAGLRPHHPADARLAFGVMAALAAA